MESVRINIEPLSVVNEYYKAIRRSPVPGHLVLGAHSALLAPPSHLSHLKLNFFYPATA